MNIFKLEFKSTFKSLLVWSITVSAVLIMFLAFYPSMNTESMRALMNAKLEAVPQFMLAAFGISEIPDFTNLVSFYTYVFQYIVLAGAIYAALLGAASIVKEESEGTIEFLYAQPITRQQIVWQKLLSSMLTYVIFAAIVAVVTIVMFLAVKPDGFDMVNGIAKIKATIVGLILTGFVFICIGFALSTFIKSVKQATTVGIAIVISTYIMGALSKIFSFQIEAIKILKYFSPIDYFNPSEIVSKGFSMVNVIVALVLMITSIFITLQLYSAKDLKS